jgi:serine/threonine protein kinase
VEIISQIVAGLIYYSDKHERPLLPLPDILRAKRLPSISVKICDLRFANCLSQPDALMDRTMSEHHLALYTPPECISGKEPDCRSQIYTLACLLYQLLTGKPPFESDDLVELQSQHLCVSAQSLDQARPDLYLPPALESCLMKALSKEPNKRHSTLRQFQLELKEAVKHKKGLLPKWPIGAVAAAVMAITAYSFLPIAHFPELPLQGPDQPPEITSPQPVDTAVNPNVSLPPVPADAIHLGELSLAGNEQKILTTGNYQCDALILKGSAQLICKGKVSLWIGRQNNTSSALSISEHARLYTDGNAEDFLLYYSSDAPIKLFDAAKLKATTLAPNALLDATGEATIQGKFSSAGQRLSDNARFID